MPWTRRPIPAARQGKRSRSWQIIRLHTDIPAFDEGAWRYRDADASPQGLVVSSGVGGCRGGAGGAGVSGQVQRGPSLSGGSDRGAVPDHGPHRLVRDLAVGRRLPHLRRRYRGARLQRDRAARRQPRPARQSSAVQRQRRCPVPQAARRHQLERRALGQRTGLHHPQRGVLELGRRLPRLLRIQGHPGVPVPGLRGLPGRRPGLDEGDGGQRSHEDAVLRRVDRDALQEPEEPGLDDGRGHGHHALYVQHRADRCRGGAADRPAERDRAAVDLLQRRVGARIDRDRPDELRRVDDAQRRLCLRST